MNIDIEFEENLPHQEGIIYEIYHRPDGNYFQELKDLESLDVMPKSNKGHKFILCIIDEVINYLKTLPLYQTRSEEVREVLI